MKRFEIREANDTAEDAAAAIKSFFPGSKNQGKATQEAQKSSEYDQKDRSKRYGHVCAIQYAGTNPPNTEVQKVDNKTVVGNTVEYVTDTSTNDTRDTDNLSCRQLPAEQQIIADPATD
jgi:hypothetical protein